MILRRATLVAALCLMCASRAGAQHDMQAMHSMRAPVRDPYARRLFNSDMRRMTGMVPVDPMGSMRMPGWGFMSMGVVRFGYNHQGGGRGDQGFESTNWFMEMAHHDLGPGRVSFMLMNSLEPATFDDPGSPQLFQTGETFDGAPLVDYQHPHDFFMNISATYRASIAPRAGVWLQYAPVGEPALGPTTFMHRASAGDNPAAPLGHHWQDATHISDNVASVGAGWNWLSVDGSAFHGRESDEQRWDIDWGAMDSYSGRVSVALPRGWSAQASYGDLHDVHADEPGDVKRTTASLHYGATGDGPMAVTLVWGRNDEEQGISNSFLAEYAHQLARQHAVFSRFEWVEKDQELLLTRTQPQGPGPHPTANVTALTMGYFHSGTMFGGLGMGGDLTFYVVPASLQPAYGDTPVSLHVFMRLRWNTGADGMHM